jgi:hypothetical protein
MAEEFDSVASALEAYDAAVRKFHNTDYDSVDELEAQEEELISAARLTIDYLVKELAK